MSIPTREEEYWARLRQREAQKSQEQWIQFGAQVLAGVGMGLIYAAGRVLEAYKEKKK
jgi:hypothetical protein